MADPNTDKKGQETLKLFGIYFIKPKNGEI